jgi:acyl-homoserine lactone acylase PvdQ
MFEEQDNLDRDDFGRMHQDDLNLRAVHTLPHLLQVLSSSPHARVQEALGQLRDWDGRMTPEKVGPTLFEVFFLLWTKRVAAERFPAESAGLVTGGLSGLAAGLLVEDKPGWFKTGAREAGIHDAMFDAIEWLKEKIGRDMSLWTWGALHTIPLKHVLSGRGELGQLLDHGGLPVRGCAVTVCNTGLGPAYEAKTGAGYRLLAELDILPGTAMVIRGDELLTESEMVDDADEIEIRAVISGGA